MELKVVSDFVQGGQSFLQYNKDTGLLKVLCNKTKDTWDQPVNKTIICLWDRLRRDYIDHSLIVEGTNYALTGTVFLY